MCSHKGSALITYYSESNALCSNRMKDRKNNYHAVVLLVALVLYGYGLLHDGSPQVDVTEKTLHGLKTNRLKKWRTIKKWYVSTEINCMQYKEQIFLHIDTVFKC